MLLNSNNICASVQMHIHLNGIYWRINNSDKLKDENHAYPR